VKAARLKKIKLQAQSIEDKIKFKEYFMPINSDLPAM
jgi:hypothetical protein